MLCSYIYYYFSKVPNGFRSVHIWDYRLIRLIYVLPKVAFCSRNVITLWFQALVMWNKSSFCSSDSTLCTRYIVSEIHPFLLHLFTILCSCSWSILCYMVFNISFFDWSLCFENWSLKQTVCSTRVFHNRIQRSRANQKIQVFVDICTLP